MYILYIIVLKIKLITNLHALSVAIHVLSNSPCPGTSHNLMLAKLYAAEMPTVLKYFSLTILNIIFLLCFSRTKYFNDHSKYSLK